MKFLKIKYVQFFLKTLSGFFKNFSFWDNSFPGSPPVSRFTNLNLNSIIPFEKPVPLEGIPKSISRGKER